MKEIKLTIDGKEVQLTDEQLKMLGIETEKNPFNIESGNQYWYVNNLGEVAINFHMQNGCEKSLADVCNAFNDAQFAERVALHQLLYRKLLKFSYDNGYEDAKEWNGKNSHWAIRYNGSRNKFCPYHQDGYKARDVYFSSEEGANRAIKEVVDPFMEEHPEFVW